MTKAFREAQMKEKLERYPKVCRGALGCGCLWTPNEHPTASPALCQSWLGAATVLNQQSHFTTKPASVCFY